MATQATVISGRKAWARLFRVPNLFTVPGDVLAGFSAAAAGRDLEPVRLLAAAAASLMLYGAGLVMNDLADVEEDRRDRPGRPLASGAVSAGSAKFVAALLLGSALLILGLQSLSLLAMGAVIGGLLFVYNLWAKAFRLSGSLCMGLCRAGNFLLGAAAVSVETVLMRDVYAGALFWLLFIAAVSWLASREMRKSGYGAERWLPALITAVGGGLSIGLAGPQTGQAMFRAILCFFFSTLLCVQAGMRLGLAAEQRRPSGRIRKINTAAVYPPAIGIMISALIPMQTGVLILHADEPWLLLAALVTLLCWPLSRLAARYVPAS